MSASDEGCVWGAGLSPEGEEPADGAPGRPGFPWGLAVGRDLGAPRSSEGDGAFPDPEGFESEWERLETGGRVLRGREGRPGSPADAQGPTLGYLADEATTALLQQLTDREALRVRRNPSPESCATQVSTLWVDVEAGSAGRGVLAQSWAGAQLASAAPLHPWAPRGGRAWGYAKRGAVGRPARGGGRQRPSGGGLLRPPSDSSDSSDEVAEIQLMRVSICRREVSQARACSPEGPGDSGRQPSFLQAPGPFPSSAARGLGPLAERQAVGELGASPEKVPSAVWGKAGGRPGYAGAAGGPPRAAPRRKAAQEKKPAGGAPKVAVGRSFPSWGQRASAAPPEPATFPTISGVRLLGRGKKHPSAPAPWSARQFKPSGAGRRPPARRGPESEPVAGEDAEPRRDPAAKGQVSTRPRPSPLPALALPQQARLGPRPLPSRPSLSGHARGPVPPRPDRGACGGAMA